MKLINKLRRKKDKEFVATNKTIELLNFTLDEKKTFLEEIVELKEKTDNFTDKLEEDNTTLEEVNARITIIETRVNSLEKALLGLLPEPKVKLLLTADNIITFMEDYNMEKEEEEDMYKRTDIIPYSKILQFFHQHTVDEVIDKLTEMMSEGKIYEPKANEFKIIKE